MSTTDLEKEKIALADRLAQRKSNTLGPDYSVHEEPFGASTIVLRDDIFSETPTSSSNFSSPNYGDDGYGGGAVATRHNKVLLYSVPSSSIDDTQSAQTFMAVHSVPESDDPVDVERVRIKHLVPPDLSPGRGHAADDDVTTRGFELALFPAYDNGGTLDAYVSFGPIPITADPTAENGIGSDARWTVDYANGIVRLTGSPISGEGSVFNPFNVFGDRDGTTNSSGRFSLFATFYRYSGPTLTDADDVNIVTVGDGTDSYGNYYGPTSSVMQMAVDSLAPFGGTVYVKEGTYNYTSTVHIPANVRVIGLSHNAKITKPEAAAAFRVFGGSSAIKGLTIYGVPTTGSRGMIRVNVDTTDELLESVDISDNYFYVSTQTESAIELDPVSTIGSVATYRNFLIRNNVFRPFSTGNRVTYITENLWSGINGQFRLDDFRVEHNDFGIHDGYAIDFSSNRAKLMEKIAVSNNVMSNELDIRIRAQDGIHQARFADNSGVGTLEVYHMTDSAFRGNAIDTLFAYEGLTGCSFSDDILGDVTLDGYIEDSSLNHISAGRFDIPNSASSVLIDGSTFSGPVTIKGEGTSVGENLLNVRLTNNQFFNDLQIACNLSGTGAYVVKRLRLEGNAFEQSVLIGTDAGSAVTDIDLFESSFIDNAIGSLSDVDALVFGTPGGNASIHLNHINVENNSLYGNVVFTDQSATSYANMDFDNNKFITADRGVRIDSHWSLNNLSFTNNRTHHIQLLNESKDITGNHVARNILVKNNILTGNGRIEFVPTGTVSGALKLQNLIVDGNTFEDAGHISILDSSAGGQNYILDGVSITNNELKYSGSYIRVFGTGSLGGLSTTSRLSVENNISDILFIGGGAITDGAILGNYANESIQVAPVSDNLVFTDNSAPYIEFNGNLSQSTLSDNNVYAFGMLIDADFDNVVMSNNNIDGYLTFNSSFTDSTLNDNAISGALSFSTTTRSTMSGNSIGGTWTNTTWDKSVGSGNTIDGNMTITDLTDSVVSGSRVGGDLSAGTLNDSRLSNNIISNTLTAGTLTDSDIINNEAGTISLSDAFTSHVDGNISRSSMTIGGVVNDASVSNNVVETLEFGSTVSRSVITGNTGMTTGSTPAINFSGSIGKTTITSNVFESTSATTNMNFPSVSDCVVADNRLLIGSGSDIVFGFLTISRVSNCVMDTGGAGEISIGRMTDSSIENCELDSPSIKLAAGSSRAMVRSHFKGCHITGAFSITSTSTDDTLYRSSICNNVLESTFSINGTSDGTHAVFRESNFNDNVIDGGVTIEAGDATVSSLALIDSSLSNNIMTGSLDIDYDASTASSITLINDSIISGNVIDGALSIAQSMTTASPGSFVVDSVVSDNRVSGAITIAPSGRVDDTPTHKNIGIANNTCDSLSVYGGISGSIIEGNTMNDSTSTFGQLVGCSYTNNSLGRDAGTGTLALDGGIDQGTTFTSNSIFGTLTIDGPVGSSVFDSNSVSSAFSTAASISESVFSDNRFVSTMTFTGGITETVFDTNSASSMTFGTGPITDVSVTGNRLVDLTINGISQNNTVISNNNIDGTMTLSATSQTSVSVIGNNTDGILIGTSVTRLVMVGNDVEGTLSVSTLNDAIISANLVNSSVTFNGSLNEVSVTGNTFNTSSGTLTLAGVNSSDSEFTNNVVVGDITCNSGGTYTRFNMSGNTIDSSITFSSVFSSSVFNNNMVKESVIFNATAPTNGGGVQNSIMIGNTCDNDFTISTTGGAGVETAFFESIFSNNKVQSNLSFTTNDDHAIMRSTISGNTVGDLDITNTDVLSTVLTSTISGNVIENDLDINNTTSSGRVLEGSAVSNNYIADRFVIGNSSTTGIVTDNTSIIGNTVIGDFIGSAGARSVSSEAYRDSIISGNSFDADCDLHGLWNNSAFSNNQIGDSFATGNISVSKLAGNLIGGPASTGTITDSGISNNEFKSSFITNIWDGVRFNGNRCVSSFSSASNSMTDCNINGNIFDGTFTCGGWVDVTCAHNSFQSTFNLITSNDPAIRRVAFSNNICGGDARFERSIGGGTDNFRDSTFTGNVIQAGTTLTIGGPASNEFAYLTFTGNTGGGSLTLDTSSGASELDGVVVVGNTMSGTLTFADGPFAVPSSGHGSSSAESVRIVAMNTFGSYVGITFTNHAIGWGNSSGTNTGTTVGSNY